MEGQLFAITPYCTIHQLDRSFVIRLHQEGLIEVVQENEEIFVAEEQLHRLERFTRLHTQLGINPEGIDVIANLLERISELQLELNNLRARLSNREKTEGVD